MTNEVMPLFWCFITIGTYLLSRVLHRRLPRWWTSPLMLTWVACFAMAMSSGTTYHDYLLGTGWLVTLLGPAMVAFVVPLYEQRALIRRYWRVLFIGIFVGSVTAVATSWLFASWLQLSAELRLSLAPRSITMPFAMLVSGQIGGVPELTAACVVITGLLGATLGELLIKLVPLRSDMARGAMFGMGAHAIGMAAARNIGEREATVAGLVMVLAGVTNVLLASVYAGLVE